MSMRVGFSLPWLLAASLLSACGYGAGSDVSTPGTGTWRSTGTTLPGVDDSATRVELDIVALEDVDRQVCPNIDLPAQEGFPPNISDEEIGSAQAEIRADVEEIQAYVAEHRQDMGQVS